MADRDFEHTQLLTNISQLEQILTVASSSNERSSTVYGS
jgi:hypothetical protein